MRKQLAGITLFTGVLLTSISVPASAAQPAGDPSDECTFLWATVDPMGAGSYFGDARLQCPITTTVGWRWTLDGQEIRRANEQRPAGEVPLFDDIQPAARPGQELCFIAMAWFNDRGKACLTI